jgi:glycosyltransferase involved in cell wall biosynthesis
VQRALPGSRVSPGPPQPAFAYCARKENPTRQAGLSLTRSLAGPEGPFGALGERTALRDEAALCRASRQRLLAMTDVCVVIPTAHRPDLLIRAIASVEIAASGFRHDLSSEIIVVDDEASDTTRDRVASVQSRHTVRYLRHPAGPGRGPAACRNLGARSATRRFLYWLDDDDEFLPNRFEQSLPQLREGRADVVLETAVRERLLPSGGVQGFLTGPGRPGAAKDPFMYLLTEPEEGHIASGATALTRDAFLRIGGIDESLRFGEDGEFLLRLSLAVRVALLPGPPVVRVHRHERSTSREDRLRYWQPLKAMRTLDRNGDWAGKCEERASLRHAMSAKVDFALTRCRLEYDYFTRLREGLGVLSCLPPSALTWRNIKSIGVWLSRRRGSE